MNQSDLITYLDDMKVVLEPLSKYTEMIKNYSTESYKLTSALVKFILNTNLGSNHHTNITTLKVQLVNYTNRFVKTVDMLELMRELTNTKHGVDNLNKKFELNHSEDLIGVHKYLVLFDDFIKLIQKNLQADNKDYYIDLFSTSNGILSVVDLINTQLRLLTNQLSETIYDINDIKNKSKFELKLYRRNDTLNYFIKDLQVIEEAYYRLAMIFEVSTSEYPLEIIKVETGSTELKLLGFEKIIEALGNVINMISETIYKKYTHTGKIQRMSEITNYLIESNVLITKLEASGVDVEANKENINLIQTKVLNDLYRLVSKNPAVKVNGEKRGIDVSTYEKYLEMSSKYLIEESDKISVDEK